MIRGDEGVAVPPTGTWGHGEGLAGLGCGWEKEILGLFFGLLGWFFFPLGF